MKRRLLGAVFVCVIVMAAAACGGGSSSDDATTTTPPSEPAESSTTTTEPESPSADAPETPELFFVSGDVDIPAGEPDELSVVLIGEAQGPGLIPIVVHNATDDAYHQMDLNAIVTGPDATYRGTGAVHAPAVLGPGEWGFGLLSVQSPAALDGFEFDVAVSGKVVDGATMKDDIEVTDATDSGSTISGTMVNILDTSVQSPRAYGICFSASDEPTWMEGDVREESFNVDPGASRPFSMERVDVECSVFAVSVSGQV